MQQMLVSRADLASLFGLSEGRITQLVVGGILPRQQARGRYDLATSVKAYVSHLKATTHNALAVERTRLTRLKADRAEVELRHRAGELVEVRAVQRQAFACARQVRDGATVTAGQTRGYCLIGSRSNEKSCDPHQRNSPGAGGVVSMKWTTVKPWADQGRGFWERGETECSTNFLLHVKTGQHFRLDNACIRRNLLVLGGHCLRLSELVRSNRYDKRSAYRASSVQYLEPYQNFSNRVTTMVHPPIKVIPGRSRPTASIIGRSIRLIGGM